MRICGISIRKENQVDPHLNSFWNAGGEEAIAIVHHLSLNPEWIASERTIFNITRE
jgi:hypothetical protein